MCLCAAQWVAEGAGGDRVHIPPVSHVLKNGYSESRCSFCCSETVFCHLKKAADAVTFETQHKDTL